MLKLLPDLVWPLTSRQIEPLMESLVQLNLIEGGLSRSQQKSLAILFGISDRWVKSSGKLDYRGKDGHARLLDDAVRFVGATPIVTRHGDLPASHLALDYNDSQLRLQSAGQAALPSDRAALLEMVRDFCEMPLQIQEQILVLLDYLAKRPIPKPTQALAPSDR